MPKSSTDNKRHFIIAGVLVVVTTVVMGIVLNGVLPLPEAASVQASTVDWLFRVHMWLIAILFSLVFVSVSYTHLDVYKRQKLCFVLLCCCRCCCLHWWRFRLT